MNRAVEKVSNSFRLYHTLFPPSPSFMKSSLLLFGLSLPLVGCLHVKTDPIKIEPIYIEITVNHRVQKELDDFFAEIDQASTTTEYQPLELETAEKDSE